MDVDYQCTGYMYSKQLLLFVFAAAYIDREGRIILERMITKGISPFSVGSPGHV